MVDFKMANNEESVYSDPNFAVICSFVNKFGDLNGTTDFSIPDLQEKLEDTKDISPEWVDFHVRLLRKAGRKSVSHERWEKALVKFCHTYSKVDAWEIERFGYKKAKLSVKISLLKHLLEAQFDGNSKFKTEVNKLTAEQLRLLPVGRDVNGQMYWFQIDRDLNLKVYREDQDDETWELIVKEFTELPELIESLTSSIQFKKEESTATSENDDSKDSNCPTKVSLDKPKLDTGQLTDIEEMEEERKEDKPTAMPMPSDAKAEEKKQIKMDTADENSRKNDAILDTKVVKAENGDALKSIKKEHPHEDDTRLDKIKTEVSSVQTHSLEVKMKSEVENCSSVMPDQSKSDSLSTMNREDISSAEMKPKCEKIKAVDLSSSPMRPEFPKRASVIKIAEKMTGESNVKEVQENMNAKLHSPKEDCKPAEFNLSRDVCIIPALPKEEAKDLSVKLMSTSSACQPTDVKKEVPQAQEVVAVVNEGFKSSVTEVPNTSPKEISSRCEENCKVMSKEPCDLSMATVKSNLGGGEDLKEKMKKSERMIPFKKREILKDMDMGNSLPKTTPTQLAMPASAPVDLSSCLDLSTSASVSLKETPTSNRLEERVQRAISNESNSTSNGSRQFLIADGKTASAKEQVYDKEKEKSTLTACSERKNSSPNAVTAVEVLPNCSSNKIVLKTESQSTLFQPQFLVNKPNSVKPAEGENGDVAFEVDKQLHESKNDHPEGHGSVFSKSSREICSRKEHEIKPDQMVKRFPHFVSDAASKENQLNPEKKPVALTFGNDIVKIETKGETVEEPSKEIVDLSKPSEMKVADKPEEKSQLPSTDKGQDSSEKLLVEIQEKSLERTKTEDPKGSSSHANERDVVNKQHNAHHEKDGRRSFGRELEKSLARLRERQEMAKAKDQKGVGAKNECEGKNVAEVATTSESPSVTGRFGTNLGQQQQQQQESDKLVKQDEDKEKELTELKTQPLGEPNVKVADSSIQSSVISKEKVKIDRSFWKSSAVEITKDEKPMTKGESSSRDLVVHQKAEEKWVTNETIAQGEKKLSEDIAPDEGLHSKEHEKIPLTNHNSKPKTMQVRETSSVPNTKPESNLTDAIIDKQVPLVKPPTDGKKLFSVKEIAHQSSNASKKDEVSFGSVSAASTGRHSESSISVGDSPLTGEVKPDEKPTEDVSSSATPPVSKSETVGKSETGEKKLREKKEPLLPSSSSLKSQTAQGKCVSGGKTTGDDTRDANALNNVQVPTPPVDLIASEHSNLKSVPVSNNSTAQLTQHESLRKSHDGKIEHKSDVAITVAVEGRDVSEPPSTIQQAESQSSCKRIPSDENVSVKECESTKDIPKDVVSKESDEKLASKPIADTVPDKHKEVLVEKAVGAENECKAVGKHGKRDQKVVKIDSEKVVGKLSDDLKIASSKPSDLKKNVSSKPSDLKIVSSKSSDLKIVSSKSSDLKIVSSKPSDLKIVSSKSSDLKIVSSKSSDLKIVSSKSSDLKIVSSKSSDLKIVSSKPSDLKIVSSKSSDLKIVSSKSSDLKIVSSKPSDLKLDSVASGDVKSDDAIQVSSSGKSDDATKSELPKVTEEVEDKAEGKDVDKGLEKRVDDAEKVTDGDGKRREKTDGGEEKLASKADEGEQVGNEDLSETHGEVKTGKRGGIKRGVGKRREEMVEKSVNDTVNEEDPAGESYERPRTRSTPTPRGTSRRGGRPRGRGSPRGRLSKFQGTRAPQNVEETASTPTEAAVGDAGVENMEIVEESPKDKAKPAKRIYRKPARGRGRVVESPKETSPVPVKRSQRLQAQREKQQEVDRQVEEERKLLAEFEMQQLEEDQKRKKERKEQKGSKGKKGRTKKGRGRPRKKDDDYEDDEEEEDDDDEEEEGDKENKKRKLKKKRKRQKRRRKGNNPWDYSSETSSSATSDQEEHHDVDDDEDEELVFNDKSDHEFSPESEAENDPTQPTQIRRARTARKVKSGSDEEDSEEQVSDDKPCSKCGNYDHPEWILLCDKCNSGFHTACLRPPLLIIPDGDWFCPPCEHAMLLLALQEQMKLLEQALKKREREEMRKKRLAYVGINLDNVLKPEKKEDQTDEEEEENQPKRSCRARREISYQFKEYDAMIQSAIHDEIIAERGAGMGKGKDMSNITDVEEKEELPVAAEIPPETGDGEKSPPLVPPVKLSAAAIASAAAARRRKKHRRLNDLDSTDEEEEEDDDSDEDFKESSDSVTPQSEEDDDEDYVEESDASWEDDRRRTRRRNTRSRKRKDYDSDFVCDEDSDESDDCRVKRRAASKRVSYRELSDSDENEVGWKKSAQKRRRVETDDEYSEDSDWRATHLQEKATASGKKSASGGRISRRWASESDSESDIDDVEEEEPVKMGSGKRLDFKSSDDDDDDDDDDEDKEKGKKSVKRRKMTMKDFEKDSDDENKDDEDGDDDDDEDEEETDEDDDKEDDDKEDDKEDEVTEKTERKEKKESKKKEENGDEVDEEEEEEEEDDEEESEDEDSKKMSSDGTPLSISLDAAMTPMRDASPNQRSVIMTLKLTKKDGEVVKPTNPILGSNAQPVVVGDVNPASLPMSVPVPKSGGMPPSEIIPAGMKDGDDGNKKGKNATSGPRPSVPPTALDYRCPPANQPLRPSLMEPPLQRSSPSKLMLLDACQSRTSPHPRFTMLDLPYGHRSTPPAPIHHRSTPPSIHHFDPKMDRPQALSSPNRPGGADHPSPHHPPPPPSHPSLHPPPPPPYMADYPGYMGPPPFYPPNYVGQQGSPHERYSPQGYHPPPPHPHPSFPPPYHQQSPHYSYGPEGYPEDDQYEGHSQPPYPPPYGSYGSPVGSGDSPSATQQQQPPPGQQHNGNYAVNSLLQRTRTTAGEGAGEEDEEFNGVNDLVSYITGSHENQL